MAALHIEYWSVTNANLDATVLPDPKDLLASEKLETSATAPVRGTSFPNSIESIALLCSSDVQVGVAKDESDVPDLITLQAGVRYTIRTRKGMVYAIEPTASNADVTSTQLTATTSAAASTSAGTLQGVTAGPGVPIAELYDSVDDAGATADKLIGVVGAGMPFNPPAPVSLSSGLLIKPLAAVAIGVTSLVYSVFL